MKTLEQLENFVMKTPTIVTASQFRGVLEGNNIPYREGWENEGDEDDYIFSLTDEPDTWFMFENDDDGEFLSIAQFEF